MDNSDQAIFLSQPPPSLELAGQARPSNFTLSPPKLRQKRESHCLTKGNTTALTCEVIPGLWQLGHRDGPHVLCLATQAPASPIPTPLHHITQCSISMRNSMDSLRQLVKNQLLYALWKHLIQDSDVPHKPQTFSRRQDGNFCLWEP